MSKNNLILSPIETEANLKEMDLAEISPRTVRRWLV